MAAPRKYPDELRARAVRMVREIDERGAIKRVADQSDINPETLRTWTRQAQVDDGERAGTPTELAEENRQLRKQLAETDGDWRDAPAIKSRPAGGYCLRAPAQGACPYASICEHCPSCRVDAPASPCSPPNAVSPPLSPPTPGAADGTMKPAGTTACSRASTH